MNDYVYVDYLAESIKKYGPRPCLNIKRKGEYHRWTYTSFNRDLNRLSSVLKKHGVKKGANAIVIGENTPEWIIAYHAILLTGACTVPIDPNIPPSEIETIVTTTRATVVFCSRVYLSLFRQLKEKHEFINQIVLLDTETKEKEPRFDQFIAEGKETDDVFNHSFMPDDPMVIIFTSGTTGKAKGVVLCQKNFVAVCKYAIPRMKIDFNDIVCAVLPLHHVFGCAASMVAPLVAGMSIVCVPYIKGPLISEALNDMHVTYLPAVPKMLQLFYDSIMHNVKKKGPMVQTMFAGLKAVSSTVGNQLGVGFQRKLFGSVHKGFGGNLRLIISGGAALSKAYWKGFRQMGFIIVEGYGLTETFGPICVCPGEQARLGSVGPALAENEIRIVDPDSNGIGEVYLRGICIFKGYYNNDELTKEVIDSDGWFNSGDIGKLDKDGFLYLSGRKKDVIVLDSGKNVFPDELEDYYGYSPLIEEIGIFGIEQEKNEIVAAVIVPEGNIRKGKSIKEATDMIYDELLRLGKSLPTYRRISDFVISYSPLPRTTTRKLKKNDLRQLYRSIKRKAHKHSDLQVELSVIELAIMETEEFGRIAEDIARISKKIKVESITPRSHLEVDFGLDSLDRLELLESLENGFSIVIPDNVFDKMESMSDLVSLVRDSAEKQRNVSVESTLGIKERIFSDANFETSVRLPKPHLLRNLSSSLFISATTPLRKAKVTGVQALSNAATPLIFAANHVHRNDLYTILTTLPGRLRKQTLFLGDHETKNYPAIPFNFIKQSMVPLENDTDPIEIMKAAMTVLRHNKNLILFPEGSILSSGDIRTFKPAIGLLALEMNATIVPIRISLSTKGIPSLIFGKATNVAAMIEGKQIENKQPSADEVAEGIRQLLLAL